MGSQALTAGATGRQGAGFLRLRGLWHQRWGRAGPGRANGWCAALALPLTPLSYRLPGQMKMVKNTHFSRFEWVNLRIVRQVGFLIDSLYNAQGGYYAKL